MKLVFKDEKDGHFIFYKKIYGNYYYFYKNTKHTFKYPERYKKTINGKSIYTSPKNYLLLTLKFEKNENLYDICLHGFYKNGKLFKNNLFSINGNLAKKIKLNYIFLNESLNHFYSLNKKIIIKSFVSKTKVKKDYENRLFFWKKLGFEIKTCNEKYFDHYILKEN